MMPIKNDEKPLRPWSVESTELVLDNNWAKVRRDWCRLPDGRVVPDYYYWVGGDFAQVFALTDKDEVILTRQYKHGVREVVLELPAGMIDPSDASPLATAQRELKEETGYAGSDWMALGVLSVSSAKATTQAYAFFTRGAVQVSNSRPDANEVIQVVLAPIHEVLDLISSGEIRDSNSVAATLLALRFLGRLK